MGLWVCTRKGLFEVDDDGSITEVHFLGVPVTAVCEGPQGTLAALRHGHYGPKLHRHTPQGWEELTAPSLPEDEEGRSVDSIWTLEVDAHGTVWAGTLPAALFRSDDGGASWTLCQALDQREERQQWFGGGFDMPGVHSILVGHHGPGSLVLGISCGGVWTSTDAGESWELVGEGLVAAYMPPDVQDQRNVQDPHRLAVCPAEPSRVWMQHHNGVFRSDDGGRTWSRLQVPPTGFGFAVAAHPSDPDTAWLVPAIKDELRVPQDGAVVVARTSDGGQTWTLLRDGLPQEHAYDLTYRHALDVDGTGSRLAFGTTTGNLWLSDDAGDHWQTLSHHLPPVYAVRFRSGGSA